ncbi:MAG: U32 family peptidase [Clostridia bacterium]|nr:U32 family peptidase [Clostridia bacterium]NCC43754.1 U32 family peptidase [Clostridia bacterium]
MDIELLAPAGSYEAMTAAFCAGADAVYLGGEKYGARAYADNLDQEKMIQAIQMAHLHGKRLYLTVNTLLKNSELENELYEYLSPLYTAGLDAVIVQDLGVLRFVKKHFPDMHIHASTQMTITGVESAKLLKEAGATRVVTARELSLKEIKAIYDATHMEIESFVHGALCYCYSGQCLMSSMIGGRSGNRGRCAQPCRLPYQVYQGQRRMNDDKTSYPLSPKDMCTVRILPDIIRAGVYSLKIEGRMKKPEYTAGVVEIYRKYLDRYLAGEKNPVVSREDYQILMDIYNRDGFHESYYKVRNGRDMMALRNEKKTVSGDSVKNKRNEELFNRIRKTYLEGKTQEKIKGTLTLFPQCPAILEVSMGEHRTVAEGEIVQEAMNRPLDRERVYKQMTKTGETEFVFEELDIFMDDGIFLPMQQLNELRRCALDKLKRQILSGHERKQQAPKQDDDNSEKNENIQLREGLCASVVSRSQLNALMQIPEITRIYADCGIFPVDDFCMSVEQTLKEMKNRGKEFFLMLPHMVRDRELNGRKEHFASLIQKGLSGFLIRNLESYGILRQLGLENQVILDANMYTMNQESQNFWKEKGCIGDTVSLEMNQKEIRHRDNTNSELVVYGYAPMMVSVQCIQKNLDGCDHKCTVFTLKDRYKKEFHAVCNCEFCYNTIYNSLPSSLLKEAEKVKKIGVSRFRLSFTIEGEKETEKIARAFVAVYAYGGKPDESVSGMETTKGHFSRGVE